MLIEFNLSIIAPKDLSKEITQRLSLDTCQRDQFGLYEEYVEWVKMGWKTTTIRYRPGEIDCPRNYVLPLIATSPSNRDKRSQIGWARLKGLKLKKTLIESLYVFL